MIHSNCNHLLAEPRGICCPLLAEQSNTMVSPAVLSDTAFLLLLVLAIVSYLALLRRRRAWSNPATPLPPGPAGLPLVGVLPFLEPDLHSYFARLAGTYGPVFSLRLGAKIGIVVSSPSAAREVLKDQDQNFANHDVPAAARVIAYGGDAEIVWNPYGPKWRMLRRVCVEKLLSPPKLEAASALRRREVRASIAHLRARAGAPVEVGTEMFLAIMNVVTSALWGGMMEGVDERETSAREFRQAVAETTQLLGRPNVSDFFPALARFDLQGIERESRAAQRRLDKIFQSIIEKRKRATTSEHVPEDFLETILRMEKGGGDGKIPFTITNVKALLSDLLLGATDTTANTLEWALAEMMQKPHVLRRAQEELDRVVGMDKVVEESHTPHLHYLGLVIKEVLRLHPALPRMIPHCPNSTSVVSGYTVPAGSRVFVNVWAIHRDPTVWEDPLEFKPERFSDAFNNNNKLDFSGKDFRYFPFGSGRRICAGIGMAERTVAFSLASLVHSFDWKLPEGAQMDMTEKFGIVLKKAQPLVAVPTPRLTNPELYN